MINQQLLNPQSIVIVGGSNETKKPGGKVLKNILDGNFNGKLFVINPKETVAQGISVTPSLAELPETDLAIIAIPSKFCLETIEVLAKQKNTKAFIVLSAGFGEENEEGKLLEQKIVEIINSVDGCLIGPNCIGFMNPNYNGVFTTPIPKLDHEGCDMISGSGATAVFIIEAGIPKGLNFSSIYSVGNSAQMGVEEVLKFLDESFDPITSSRVKILYIETIKNPAMLLKHASSLVRKGCRIAAIKSGSSNAGIRAAASHTGALASPDLAVNALFYKAGIVRCYGREELTTIASVFLHKELIGKRIAIITHAGGPAVMLTDSLENRGLEVPYLHGKNADELLLKLYPGSSVSNPIDFLATGTADQLGIIIDYCENKFDEIDAMIVIFGSPGLFEVYDVYRLLNEKIKKCKKPIFTVLPSIINVEKELKEFISFGRINFPDEVALGKALTKVYFTPKPFPENFDIPEINTGKIRAIIESAENGFISPSEIHELLNAAGIPIAKEFVVNTIEDAVKKSFEVGFPLVMKVVGPVHKSDVGGVVLNINDIATVEKEFKRMIKISDTTSILIQPMLNGTELFVGAKYENKFGHLILCGLGGIFIEVLKDVSSALVPIGIDEALGMIKRLKSYKIIQGVRGQEGVNEKVFADVIARLSALLLTAPEIAELDLNPLLGTKNQVIAVDARINIKKD